ncbi:CocE/NonD family hydrolase [Arsenicitalea aurantiaca]|uniref:CocE/NonD family hydrolase n=1 Tax=Arsenicitalea aurantiaca TaxID=1783274 RepID=A0A433X2G7_9HYPH|nr:CocE/NonD family hydrolase [Arsenicitalea aurantiaca]RUT28284.1 CocE/NonD family hydrolase [Arsenicitalea aurantiaca]
MVSALPAPSIVDTVLRDVMVPMRDGVRLATDIFLPEGDGPWPVLMERTPYDKTQPRANEFTLDHPGVFGREELAGFFVGAGFAVVFQDCRGRYASEGRFTKYRGEAEDGFDTLQWIHAQGWCDGRIGTFGLSYSAHTQLSAAALNPPGLKAMLLDCGGFSNAYQGGIRFGGALELKQATWAFRHALRSREVAADPEKRAALEAIDLKAWFRTMPWSRGNSPLSAVPGYEDYLFEQWEKTLFDDYWKIPSLYAAGYYERMAKMPSVHISGWYDPYAVTAVENFSGLRALGHPTSLILGPWTHGARSKTYAGDVDFGAAATFEAGMGQDFVTWRIAYFRNVLDGEPAPGMPVRVFVMGGGSGRTLDSGRRDHGGAWISARSWPPEQAEPICLYLDRGGSLSRSLPTGEGRHDYLADPARPVPTIGGPITSGAPLMEGGAYDQRADARFFGGDDSAPATAERDDVLVFETEPLSEDLVLIGDVSVALFARSDAENTDFTVKLVDVYPDGFAMNLSDGILRACYRDGFEKAVPLSPGEPERFEIRLYPTANRFAKGHRVRIEVASSNFPRFDICPNVSPGNDLDPDRRIARNTILTGPETPSALHCSTLPVAHLG